MGRRAYEYDRVEEKRDPLFGGTYKWITLKSGRQLTLLDAIKAAESAQQAWGTAMSRAFKLHASEWDFEWAERTLERMEDHCRALRHHIEGEKVKQAEREKIAALRNTMGRTPEEAEAYRRKADQLEAKLGAR